LYGSGSGSVNDGGVSGDRVDGGDW